MAESLFGNLALRFSSSPENLATEALNYILGKSTIARKSFVDFINQCEVKLSTDLTFQTQSTGEDNSIPDIVGINTEGQSVLIGEAKFWAGLTDNQPLSYIKRLPDIENSVMLFISPAKRFSTLWPELYDRCKIGGISIQETININEGLKFSRISENQILVLCSWQRILSTIFTQLKSSNLDDDAEDIHQLMGLCDRMDTHAFVPIQSEELSSGNGLRYSQFNQIVDDLADTLISRKKVSKKGLRSGATSNSYIRYVRTNKYGLGIQFNSYYWSTIRETPLWITVKEIPEGSPWIFPFEGKQKLLSLELEQPSRLNVVDDSLLIPLYILIGEEKPKVISNLVNQVEKIINLLGN